MSLLFSLFLLLVLLSSLFIYVDIFDFFKNVLTETNFLNKHHLNVFKSDLIYEYLLVSLQ